MRTTSFIFSAEPLGNAKIYNNCYYALEDLNQSIMNKLGQILKKQLRLYRVPIYKNQETSTMDYNQYALIVYQGERSDCLLEIICNYKTQQVKWPKRSDIELGKRLTIEVVDWVDAYLLIDYLMRDMA